MAIGWKCVMKWKGQEDWKSVCLGNGSVTYNFGEFALRDPEYGPLCVFKTWQDAKRFMGSNQLDQSETACPMLHNGYAIFPCEYVPSSAERVWNEYISVRLCELPEGTALADAVRIF